MESTATAQDAYNLQYVSLLMIILTFVVGALLRPQAPPPPKSPFENWDAAHHVGDISLAGLFLDPQGRFEEFRLAGLVEVLKCHDIDADIAVYPRLDVADRTDSELARGLAQSVTLARYLEGQGIPAGALNVMARSPGSTRGEVRISLFRSSYAKRRALF